MSPRLPTPDAPFEAIGGEAGVRALVDRFYDLMDSLPEAADIRAMHPTDLAGSRDKLAWFLTGWLGGPPHYVERFGHPRLRMRHMPFAIGEDARDQWMLCMRQAIAELLSDSELGQWLEAALAQVADFMRNQPGK